MLFSVEGMRFRVSPAMVLIWGLSVPCEKPALRVSTYLDSNFLLKLHLQTVQVDSL